MAIVLQTPQIIECAMLLGIYLCGSLQLIRLEEVRYQDGFEGRSPICCSLDDLY